MSYDDQFPSQRRIDPLYRGLLADKRDQQQQCLQRQNRLSVQAAVMMELPVQLPNPKKLMDPYS
jgi:hypothetical protein